MKSIMVLVSRAIQQGIRVMEIPVRPQLIVDNSIQAER
jgi:hypothetical protein